MCACIAGECNEMKVLKVCVCVCVRAGLSVVRHSGRDSQCKCG